MADGTCDEIEVSFSLDLTKLLGFRPLVGSDEDASLDSLLDDVHNKIGGPPGEDVPLRRPSSTAS